MLLGCDGVGALFMCEEEPCVYGRRVQAPGSTRGHLGSVKNLLPRPCLDHVNRKYWRRGPGPEFIKLPDGSCGNSGEQHSRRRPTHCRGGGVRSQAKRHCPQDKMGGQGTKALNNLLKPFQSFLKGNQRSSLVAGRKRKKARLSLWIAMHTDRISHILLQSLDFTGCHRWFLTIMRAVFRPLELQSLANLRKCSQFK